MCQTQQTERGNYRMKTVERLNIPNCIRLSNAEVKVIVTIDVGIRREG